MIKENMIFEDVMFVGKIPFSLWPIILPVISFSIGLVFNFSITGVQLKKIC